MIIWIIFFLLKNGILINIYRSSAFILFKPKDEVVANKIQNDFIAFILKPKPTKEIKVTSSNSVDVLVKNNELTIQTYQSAIANVEVYDVLGKLIFTKNGIHNKQFNTSQITASKQALLVKIHLENGEVVVKKIIM